MQRMLISGGLGLSIYLRSFGDALGWLHCPYGHVHQLALAASELSQASFGRLLGVRPGAKLVLERVMFHHK